MVTKLFDASEISLRVSAVAAEIVAALSVDFTVVGLLKGSFVLMADLVRALDAVGAKPRIEFIRLSSYGNTKESSGRVQRIGELPNGLVGRRVLLVDDIVDTGRSMAHAKEELIECGVDQIWTCALVDKSSRREVHFEADFVGFSIDDVFVVGYGIDYAEDYRHLPYIGKID
jgi:hypoxanthine phosphoribosyltransferase|tara:strand:- start:9354 stop:9869 length:516 start_codon:yes stop_codon:yes gene_type:complete